MALYALPSPDVAATTVITGAFVPSPVRVLPAGDMVETTSSGQAMFEEALVRHLNALHRFALRLTGQGNDAEDLVQETVARALERRTQFHPGSNLAAWLCTIM